MAELVLSFLGPWQVRHARKGQITLRGYKAQALLAYLAVGAKQPHSRDTLIGLLWPELSESDARNNLRVGLSRLRQTLESKTDQTPLFILSDRYVVQFNPESDFQLDVADLEDLLTANQQHLHANLANCADCRARLTQVVDLYQGEFLVGFHLDDCLAFDEWLSVQRERYHVAVMQALDQLIAALQANNEYKATELYARRQLTIDPLHEGGHQALIQALVDQGLRTQALSQFQACETLLMDELGIPPNAEIQGLVEQVKQAASMTADKTKREEDVAAAPPPPPLPTDWVSHLEPRPDQRLFGIQEAREKLKQRLQIEDRPWLIAINGIGGIGKTTLATLLAHDLAEASHYHQVAWVSAKQVEFQPEIGLQKTGRPALDVETLIDALCQQLDPRSNPLVSLAEKQAAIGSLLKEKPYLVVVDNLETAIDYESLLPTLRQWANPTKFLLTSRFGLQMEAGVYSHSINELSQKNALAFLSHEAEFRDIEPLRQSTPDQLERIYGVVGGNPLALKLVIGQLRFLPLDQVLGQLQEAKGGQVDILYTYIYWQVWHQLNEESRHLLLLMPIYPSTTFANLAAVSGLEPDPLMRGLQHLLNLSLLEVAGTLEVPRYRLHRLTETFLLNEVLKWQA